MHSTNLSPAAVELGDFDVRARAINEALSVAYGDRGTIHGIRDVVALAAAALDRLGYTGSPQDAGSSRVSVVDSIYAEALALLDDLERVVRPAVVESRRLAAELAQDLGRVEAVLAERAAADALEEQIEAAVQDEVEQAERKRLAVIETKAREAAHARVAATMGAH